MCVSQVIKKINNNNWINLKVYKFDLYTCIYGTLKVWLVKIYILWSFKSLTCTHGIYGIVMP